MSNTNLSWYNFAQPVTTMVAINSDHSVTNDAGLLTPQLSDAAVFEGILDDEDAGIVTTFYKDIDVTLGFGAGGPDETIRACRMIAVLDFRMLAYKSAVWPAAEYGLDGQISMRVTLTPEIGAVHDSGFFDVDLRPRHRLPNNLIYIIPDDVDVGVVSTVRIRIRLTGTDGQPYTASIGRIWCGNAFSTQFGLEAGWEMSVIDNGDMGLSVGGQGYPDIRMRARRASASWAPIGFDVAFGNAATPDEPDMQSIMSHVGTTGVCVFALRTQNAAGDSDAHITRRLGLYGHFEQLGSLRDLGGDQFAWGPFTFRELL